MQRTVHTDPLQQLAHDPLHDAGDDVTDQQDQQEPDQLRNERKKRVQALLDGIADVDGGEDCGHEKSSLRWAETAAMRRGAEAICAEATAPDWPCPGLSRTAFGQTWG